jgi:hypothetical protein
VTGEDSGVNANVSRRIDAAVVCLQVRQWRRRRKRCATSGKGGTGERSLAVYFSNLFPQLKLEGGVFFHAIGKQPL